MSFQLLWFSWQYCLLLLPPEPKSGLAEDLALSDEAFAGLQAEIASKGLTKKVADFAIISVDMVLFDDNTGWISGNPVVRDKDNPSRWVRDKSAEA